jgi:hypothetical protein
LWTWFKQPQKDAGPVHFSGVFANVFGAIVDSLGVQSFAMGLLELTLLSFVGSDLVEVDLTNPGGLLSVAMTGLGGLLLLAVLARGVVRVEHVKTARAHARAKIRTVSVPYFVGDALWMGLGLYWLARSMTGLARGESINRAFDLYGPVVLGAATVVLLGIRVRVWRENRG